MKTCIGVDLLCVTPALNFILYHMVSFKHLISLEGHIYICVDIIVSTGSCHVMLIISYGSYLLQSEFGFKFICGLINIRALPF